MVKKEEMPERFQQETNKAFQSLDQEVAIASIGSMEEGEILFMRADNTEATIKHLVQNFVALVDGIDEQIASDSQMNRGNLISLTMDGLSEFRTQDNIK